MGELLLFPPWLVHSVWPSEGASHPRVSLTFNFFTTREDCHEEVTGRINREALQLGEITLSKPEGEDAVELKTMIQEHYQLTGSVLAKSLLDNFDKER